MKKLSQRQLCRKIFWQEFMNIAARQLTPAEFAAIVKKAEKVRDSLTGPKARRQDSKNTKWTQSQ